MIIWIFLIIILALYHVRLLPCGFQRSYIDLDRIQPIKGIFLLLIFSSHFAQYVSMTGPLNEPYLLLRKFLGQLVVAPFLFYSGYGIGESIRKRGKSYIDSMPRRRILKVLFQFDVAVLLFVLLNAFQGKTYSISRILLTLIGWQGIGNSNWYVFAILFLYFSTYVSFCTFKDNELIALFSVTIEAAIFTYFVQLYREGYWYNTVLAYITGLWYSRYKVQFEEIVFSSQKSYYLTLTLLVLSFRIFHQHWNNIICYELTAATFALIVVMVTAKVVIHNRILQYCGEHLFSLFILQRLPMQALKNTELRSNIALYFVTCLVVTFAISYCFDCLISMTWPIIESKMNQYFKRERIC